MVVTHVVLDLVYTPNEGQEVYEGSEDQCYNWIVEQGGASFMYKVIPKVV